MKWMNENEDSQTIAILDGFVSEINSDAYYIWIIIEYRSVGREWWWSKVKWNESFRLQKRKKKETNMSKTSIELNIEMNKLIFFLMLLNWATSNMWSPHPNIVFLHNHDYNCNTNTTYTSCLRIDWLWDILCDFSKWLFCRQPLYEWIVESFVSMFYFSDVIACCVWKTDFYEKEKKNKSKIWMSDTTNRPNDRPTDSS